MRAAAGPLRVLALIETARGVEQAGAVAAADGVTRLVFGTLDLALDLDLDIEQAPDGLGYAAGRLAVASRIAGLPAPVAGVTPQLDDQARLLADLAWSRRHGHGDVLQGQVGDADDDERDRRRPRDGPSRVPELAGEMRHGLPPGERPDVEARRGSDPVEPCGANGTRFAGSAAGRDRGPRRRRGRRARR